MSALTLNDGVFSAWKGHSPTQRVPTRRRETCSPTITSRGEAALTRSMSSSTIPIGPRVGRPPAARPSWCRTVLGALAHELVHVARRRVALVGPQGGVDRH